MEYIYIGIALLIVVAIVIFIVKKNSKPEPKKVEIDELHQLIINEDVNKIEFKRNKIILHVPDGNKFNTDALLAFGAKGIHVIGDKIKFYFDGDKNETYYNQMKEWVGE
ncbi:MAG: ATP-dependent metallopeptidase FtsH/Yme1/Tma family protein [Candidatus Izemoplasma sp.]|nr:ATP-dependent metallopeptidase FtsH/Yme1/Tma family protein [Candidatus Izemoplasma sp.]